MTPLTDEQIDNIALEYCSRVVCHPKNAADWQFGAGDLIEFARALLAAPKVEDEPSPSGEPFDPRLKRAEETMNARFQSALGNEDEARRLSAAGAPTEAELLAGALTRLLRHFPTDTDMAEAGWTGRTIEAACKAYDAARAALGLRPHLHGRDTSTADSESLRASAGQISQSGESIEAAPTETERIEAGDEVHHAPTGEDWVVKRVDGKHLEPCGWPPCRALVSDCTLLRKVASAQPSGSSVPADVSDTDSKD